MLVVGLTGSIGMGKSTVAAMLRERGIGVFDADAEVHRLYNAEAVPLIERAFPGTVIDGVVDRVRLGAVVTGDPAKFRNLEEIVHPLVRRSEKRFLDGEQENGAALAVLEIPLLYETAAEANLDAVIVVSAPADVQRARVLARPGASAGKLDALLARQLPDAEKCRRADFVVDTGQSLEGTAAEVDAILAGLKSRAAAAYERHWRHA
jgi:dephospho-CoA kinase